MKNLFLTGVIALAILLGWMPGFAQANKNTYLADVKTELQKQWPKNRTINLVFHGHSVPAGYFKTPFVNTFASYPYLALKAIKEKYPNAVVNVIITAIGGENSVNGEKRFKKDVLIHKPDVLFIDYALNDQMIGLEKSKTAMSKMIKLALKKGIKVILFTPSPHMKYNILDTDNVYEPFAKQFTDLAKEYSVGLVDSYSIFKAKITSGHQVTEYMAQTNHPNQIGNQLIADGILEWF